MWFGMLEFGFLSCLAVAAALAVCVRGDWRSRAELAVCTGILAHALVCFPILFLGWTNFLYRSTLAVVSLGVSLAAIALSCIGRPLREHAADVAAKARSLMRLPLDGI